MQKLALVIQVISSYTALAASRRSYIIGLVPLSEKAIIARIRKSVAKGRNSVRVGIGDDCAVLKLPAGHEALITTDFSFEGIHFRREWHSADSVGHRCLTRGISDIAAMGGEPIAVFLSLALPRNLRQSWIDGFLNGFLKLARRFNVTLAGGDIAESPAAILADVVVLGSVPRGRAILRSAARPGDLVYVTGSLGSSAAALNLLLTGNRQKLRATDFPAHFYPEPRIAVGKSLLGKASAMIDVSDGLSTDLGHICEESGCGAEVDASAVPRGQLSRKTKAGKKVGLEFALNGGDDYELIFTAPAKMPVPARIAGVPITRIGRIIRGKHIFLADPIGHRRKLKPKGWEHFRRT